MRPRTRTTIATYAVLCIAGGITLVMPDSVAPPTLTGAEAVPAAPPSAVRPPAEARRESAPEEAPREPRLDGAARAVQRELCASADSPE